MHKVQIIRLLVLVALLSSAGCNKEPANEIEFGTVENCVYQNSYFPLSITLPMEWSVHNLESRQHIMEVGNQILAGEDKNLKAIVKASSLNTVYLLSVSKYPIGATVPSNPTLQCIAEKIRHMPGIQTGKDYLFHLRKVLESGQMDITFPCEVVSKSIGGKDFDLLQTEISMRGIIIRQKIYVTVIKGYALLITESFSTDDESEELGSILNTLTFK